MRKVLVIGSINVDLYQPLTNGEVKFGGKTVSIASIKGQTLPAKSFLQNEQVALQLRDSSIAYEAGGEEVRCAVTRRLLSSHVLSVWGWAARRRSC